MKGYAWTVFAGREPEAVPVEIIGLWKNAWGPKQDIILAKMGGKALRTNVAGGMSGSPVYVDGKLVGAVALRLSVFSPDAICGITPIELMLEINDYDSSLPSDARTPDKVQASAAVPHSGRHAGAVMAAGTAPNPAPQTALHDADRDAAHLLRLRSRNVLQQFGPMFQQLGLTAVQGGAGAALDSPKPAAGMAARAAAGRCRRRRAGFRGHERHRARARSPTTTARTCSPSATRSSISARSRCR